jgi:hypothetical protein
MSRRMHRLTAWIAAFAILLAALAPSISHALAAKRNAGAPWNEICSVSDASKAGFGKTAPAPADQLSHLKHCPFCSMHGGTTGLPPSEHIALIPASGDEIRPARYYQSPRPLFVWAAAQSRAPPVLS